MKRIALLTALLAGVALAGPAQNNVIIGTSQEPAGLADPWNISNMSIATEMNWNIYSPALAKTDAGTMLPVVLSRAPTQQNGDYRINRQGDRVVSNTVIYRIRPDARWSDNRPITVADFQLWLQVAQDERVPMPTRDPWDTATIQPTNDPRVFAITFNPPYLFADQVPMLYAPNHIMGSAWNQFKQASQGQNPARTNELFNEFIGRFTTARNLPPVSSGPFRVTQWRAGSSVTMQRNPNFWIQPAGGAANYAQQIIYRFITDTNTLRVNVLSGQVDTVATVGLSLDQGLELNRTAGNRYSVEFVAGGIWEHVDVNQFTNVEKVRQLGLNDPRTRQALLYALNRPALVQQLFQGRQPVSHSFVSPLSPLYKRDITQYEYNPQRARQLLEAMGWRPGADGILVRNGVPFRLDFATTSGNRVRERAQQILIQQWRQIGIDVRVANQPANVVFDPSFINRASEGRWDMFMFAWVQDPTLENGNLLNSRTPSGESNVPTAQNGYSGQLIGGWQNAEYDRLAAQANLTFDPAVRRQLFDRMQVIYTEQVPIIPLFNRASVVTRAPGLVNYSFSALSQYPTWQSWNIGWQQRGARASGIR